MEKKTIPNPVGQICFAIVCGSNRRDLRDVPAVVIDNQRVPSRLEDGAQWKMVQMGQVLRAFLENRK